MKIKNIKIEEFIVFDRDAEKQIFPKPVFESRHEFSPFLKIK